MKQAINSEEHVFNVAREIASAEARAAYLKDACGDDAALAKRVAALLKIAEDEGSFLEEPPPGVQATARFAAVT